MPIESPLLEILLISFILIMGIASDHFCKRSAGFPFVYLLLAVAASFVLYAVAGFYLWLLSVGWYFLGMAIMEGIYVLIRTRRENKERAAATDSSKLDVGDTGA